MTDAKSLWQDYWFLTREIEHYWQKNEHDLCFDLMEQRERLQARLDTTNDDFRLTPEGQKLLAQLMTVMAAAVLSATVWIKKASG